jgi:hypothetical protein
LTLQPLQQHRRTLRAKTLHRSHDSLHALTRVMFNNVDPSGA